MERAVEILARAFELRCNSGDGDGSGRPRIGVFGDGLPEALVVAAGADPVEVKAPPSDDALAEAPRAVAALIEDFVDPFAVRFLHRFAAGWYRSHAAIVFSRDDVAALTAYQYARELRRQRMLAQEGPKLILWNLVHDRSEAAHRFNMVQARRLLADLATLTGAVGDEDRLGEALTAEAARRVAVGRLESARVPGQHALVWRNAGRWLPAERHAALLNAALLDPPRAPRGPRIGVVGTAVIDPAFHAVLETVGPVVTDLQPYGAVWPACHAGGPDLDGVIRSAASYPLHLRAAPPGRFRGALVEQLAGCDLVVSQVDPCDDAFGWEVPSLSAAVARRGARLVDLGFRPFDLDEAWLEAARRRVGEAAGGAR